MFWTDGPFVTAASLNIVDGEFSTVAADMNIVVDSSSSSLVTRSIDGAGTDFLSKIQNFSGYLLSIGPNTNGLAAVLNVLASNINRPRAFLQQVVVHEPDTTSTAIRRWVEYYVLHDFYRSVFHRKINDRFEAKMNMYGQERRRHWEIANGTGFPIVLSPLQAPGSLSNLGWGTWSSANVSTVASGVESSATWQVGITWCSLPAYVSPQNQGQAESASAQPVSILVPVNNVIRVDITSLVPPNGTMSPAQGTAQGFYPPMAATHWNIYAGATVDSMTLQNNAPVPIATKTYTFAGAPTSTGALLNAGQPSNYFFSIAPMLWRG